MAFKEVDPGILIHRLDWQQLVETVDGFGDPIQTWNTQGTYWGFLETLSGKELVNAQQLKATTTHQLTMRQVVTVSPKDRFIWDGATYNVTYVIKVDNRNGWYKIFLTQLAT